MVGAASPRDPSLGKLQPPKSSLLGRLQARAVAVIPVQALLCLALFANPFTPLLLFSWCRRKESDLARVLKTVFLFIEWGIVLVSQGTETLGSRILLPSPATKAVLDSQPRARVIRHNRLRERLSVHRCFAYKDLKIGIFGLDHGFRLW